MPESDSQSELKPKYFSKYLLLINVFWLNKFLWHYLVMDNQKKPMGCLKMLMYIILAFILIMIFTTYLSVKQNNEYLEELALMSEDEKKEYYQESEKRNTATKIANEKREAADGLEYCQTASHALIRKAIKNSLKDPRSFKEVGHKYYTNAIELSYTATNGFGGRITEAYRYHYEPDVCGTNSKVEKIR